MTAHAFILEYYSMGVSKGTCSCGAMRFFANNTWSSELQKRADKLNEELGINKVHEKGEVMAIVTGSNIQGLDGVNLPEIKGTNNDKMSLGVKLPAVPQKPLGRGPRITAYYEQNKEQILQDWGEIGKKAMRARWGISSSFWCILWKRWRMASPKVQPLPKLVENPILSVSDDLSEIRVRQASGPAIDQTGTKDKVIEQNRHENARDLPLRQFKIGSYHYDLSDLKKMAVSDFIVLYQGCREYGNQVIKGLR